MQFPLLNMAYGQRDNRCKSFIGFQIARTLIANMLKTVMQSFINHILRLDLYLGELEVKVKLEMWISFWTFSTSVRKQQVTVTLYQTHARIIS